MVEDGGTNRELCHLRGRADDGLDVANVDLASDVQSTASSAFDHIPLLVAGGWFHREELIRLGVHGGAEEMKGEVPACNEASRVDAGEGAGQLLVVDVWSGLGIKVPLFQKLNEFEHITVGKILWECCWNELLDEFRDAIQHGSKRCRVEADDGTA